MFGTKARRIKELTTEITQMEYLLEKAHAYMEAQERELDRLNKANEKLMDRLMATDFQTYTTFKLPERVDAESEYDALSDDENAGEVMSVEQIS